jgi:anti-sigma factor RsiW
MSERRITFEALNTYVDGELDSVSAAAVAKAVAEDPVLASEVAALSRLRVTVAESIEVPSLSVCVPKSSRRRSMAIAASIVLIMVVAGSVLFANLERGTGMDWITRVWQVHHGWSVASVGPQTRPKLLFAQFDAAVPGAYVPDLSASRLSLVYATVAPFTDQRQALLAGYRGTRGCKISLLVFPSRGELGEAISAFRDGNNEAYGWRAGALSYFVLSDGMDSERFKLLAESVRHASREHLPFDKGIRVALRKSRDESAPCVT